jgi:hypothetical protein
MDWLWGSSSKDPKKDPTKQLEPGLREYLDKESPGKYAPAPSALPAPQPPSDQQPAPTAPGQDADKPTVPPQTSFPDGRYAHLWKTYRPPQDSDIGIKEELSAAEKVIETAKYRKSLTFRAALENCAEEQFAFQNCLINGDLSNRIKAAVTMCQLQNRAFNRCFMVQGVSGRAGGSRYTPFSSSFFLGCTWILTRPPCFSNSCALWATSGLRYGIQRERKGSKCTQTRCITRC